MDVTRSTIISTSLILYFVVGICYWRAIVKLDKVNREDTMWRYGVSYRYIDTAVFFICTFGWFLIVIEVSLNKLRRMFHGSD